MIEGSASFEEQNQFQEPFMNVDHRGKYYNHEATVEREGQMLKIIDSALFYRSSFV